MYSALFVIYAIAIVIASPIPVHDCGVLDSPHATYQLASNIIISNLSYGYVCLNIKGNGITLDGNGFGVSSATDTLLPAVGVQFSGTGATVTNLRITNLRTGIHANAKFGKVSGNTVTRAVNGIDVTATHNEISNNIIQDFDTTESASGIYVYFPAMAPVDSSIVIANNKIHDIRGEPFALGISVYYATSVVIKNNQIFNLHGISAEEISVINSKADLVDNVFNPITQDYDTATLLLSGFALLASLFYYSCSSNSTTPIPVPVSAPAKKVEKEEEEEEEEEEEFEEDKVSEEEKKKKEEEKAAFDKDGADEIRLRRPTVSFSIKASPSLG